MREGFQAWLKRLGAYWSEGYIETPDKEHAYALISGHLCQDGKLAMSRLAHGNAPTNVDELGKPRFYYTSGTAAGGVGTTIQVFGSGEHELHSADEATVLFAGTRIEVDQIWVYHNDTAARTVTLGELPQEEATSLGPVAGMPHASASITNAVYTLLWPVATINSRIILDPTYGNKTSNLVVQASALVNTKVLTVYVKYRRIL